MYIVIAGGGKIGEYLASVLLSSGNDVAVIEENLATADRLSVALQGRYLVIHGDGCDSKYQEDAGIRRADVFVATTGQDDDNLVSCEIAQRVFNVPRCIARVNSPKNLRIFKDCLLYTSWFLPALIEAIPGPGLWLLVGGGICYSIGCIFYVLKKVPYMHSLFHLWVLAGSVLQFLAIFLYVM